MLEKMKRLKIKFINFKEKKKGKNEQINIQKVKEVRTLSNSSSTCRHWIHQFFYEI